LKFFNFFDPCLSEESDVLLFLTSSLLLTLIIIAPIQLFVKGFFQDFYLLGEWSMERAHDFFFSSHSQELHLCHPLDNYYITTNLLKCQ